MKSLIPPALAIAVLLGACQVKAPTLKRPPAVGSVKPTGGSPSVAPKASPSPLAPTRLVKGTVRIDAHYIISDNGLGILSDNGLGLIGNNGGGVMVVDNQPITIGSGIVSNNGAGVVVSGRTRYGLLADASVAVGQIMAVEGMGVVAVSLLTGKPISGAVRSDAQGRFSLAVTEAITENIRLVAKVPTAMADDPRQQDARLTYELLVSPTAAQEGELNEDTRVASRYLREAARDKIGFLLAGNDATDEATLKDPSLTGGAQIFIMQMAKELRAAVQAAKVPTSGLSGLGQRVLDGCLAYVDLANIAVDKDNTIWKGAPADAKAIAVMGEAFAELRLAATAKMAQQPTFFVGKPYLEKASTRRLAVGLPPYEIKRPSDFVDFIFDEYIADNSARYDEMDAALEDLGLTAKEDGHYLIKSKLSASAKSIFLQIALTITGQAEAKQAILQLIRDAGR